MAAIKDYGERHLISWIEKEFLPSQNEIISIGDDCSVLRLPGTKKALVSTIDASPKPLCMTLGYKDMKIYGWYSVIVNLSDVASMGAETIGLLLSVTANKSLDFKDFKRFFSGVKEACDFYGCPLLGGNLNEGDDFSVHGSAFGLVDPNKMMLRRNAEVGDVVLVAGNLGLFWASYIALQKKHHLSSIEKSLTKQALCKPLPQISVAQKLSSLRYSKCAMDVTDGLTPALIEIASKGSVGIRVSFQDVQIHPFAQAIAKKEGVDPLKIMRGWGDWLLLFTAKEKELPRIRRLSDRFSVTISKLGIVVDGNGEVYSIVNGIKKNIQNIDAERYTDKSYNINSVELYMRSLLEMELFE